MSASPRGPVGIHVERGNQQRRIKVVGADGEVKAEVPHYAVVQALVEREGIATSLTPDALVEEELRAITVCEECRERPLGMHSASIDIRRHKRRPWLCRECAIASWHASRSQDDADEATRRRSESISVAWARLTPEQRRERSSAMRAKPLTHELRSAAAHKAWATKRAKQAANNESTTGDDR